MKTTSGRRPWIFNSKSSGKLEVLLYEQIGQDWWTGDGVTAAQFAEDLKAAGSVSHVHLRVNSPGGSVFDGIAIFNTLLNHGAKITAAVDGLAASIASVIVMAASEISMGENAMMMIHNPWTTVQGDSNDMRRSAETMDKIKVSMIEAYQRHTTKSAEEISALCDAETWMTADEAVDMGFAETVTTPEEEDDIAARCNPRFDLSIFQRTPPQISARMGRKPRKGTATERRAILARHEAGIRESRLHTQTMHELELSSLRSADAAMSDGERRRRKLAEHAAELRQFWLELLSGSDPQHYTRARMARMARLGRETTAERPWTIRAS